MTLPFSQICIFVVLHEDNNSINFKNLHFESHFQTFSVFRSPKWHFYVNEQPELTKGSLLFLVKKKKFHDALHFSPIPLPAPSVPVCLRLWITGNNVQSKNAFCVNGT